MRIFKKKWESEKVEKRLKWIENANVKSIKDKSALEKLALSDNDPKVRLAAIGKVDNQKLLAKIIINETKAHILDFAIKKLKDIDLLLHTAKNIKSYNVRKKLYAKFGNDKTQEMLLDIAKNDKNSEVRSKAVNKIGNNSMLQEILKKENDYSIRLDLYSKLNLQNSEQAIIDNIFNSFLHYEILENLDKIDDNQILKKIVDTHHDIDIIMAAVEKTTDDEILINIARNNPQAPVRQKAVLKITDENVLADIAKSDKSVAIRKMAVNKIADQNLLAEIAASEINQAKEKQKEKERRERLRKCAVCNKWVEFFTICPFCKITVCEDCRIVAGYSDYHTNYACPKCFQHIDKEFKDYS